MDKHFLFCVLLLAFVVVSAQVINQSLLVGKNRLQRIMQVKTAVLLAAVAVLAWAVFAVRAGEEQNIVSDYEKVEVASGFTWAENLIFDGHGNLFVTDAYRGELWRITATGSTYNQTLHVSGFKRFLGLAVSADGSILYAVGVDPSDTCLILTVDRNVPNSYQTVAKLPKYGNGLALHFSQNVLYSPTEGSFIPYNGEVFRIEIDTGKVTSLATSLTSADGAWIDQARDLLYVSEVISSTVLVYDLSTQTLSHTYTAPNCSMLDDYTLSADGSVVYGADFWRCPVLGFVLFSADTVLSGVTCLRSIRMAMARTPSSLPGC
jgi:hypothetical protein